MLITKRPITGAGVQSTSHLEGRTKCPGGKVSALVPAIYQREGNASRARCQYRPASLTDEVELHVENTTMHMLHSISGG